MSKIQSVALAVGAMYIGLFASFPSPALAGNFPTAFLPGDYPTNHFDDRRTGWNPNETVLNVTNVAPSTFGVVWTAPTDSRSYAQPLVAMQEMVGGAPHNVVFVGTSNDTLYAFDADLGTLLWSTSFQNAAAGVTAVPDTFFKGCLTFAPSLGITQTPIYDRSTHSLYVVAATLEGPAGQQHIYYRLHQISVATGLDMQSPALISGSVVAFDGSTLTFNPDVEADRPGLLESNGNIYIGFGSFDDFYANESHGWIFAYTAAMFAPVGVFATTRGALVNNTYLGSIWAGGHGIAADDNGNVYFATGNGPLDGTYNFGDALIKLPATLASSQLQFFSPSNNETLFADDKDLGSGGPVLFPVQTGKYPDLVWLEGKNDNAYLINADLLTGISSSTNKGYIRSIKTRAIFGSGAFYQDLSGTSYYYTNDALLPTHLARYTITIGKTNAAYTVTKTSVSTVGFTRLGGATTVVSSNGTAPGTAIVWYIDRPTSTGPLNLYAYDATNLTTPLFSGVAGQWSIAGSGALIEPTVTNGKAYVAADNQITAFGLLPGAARTRGLPR